MALSSVNSGSIRCEQCSIKCEQCSIKCEQWLYQVWRVALSDVNSGYIKCGEWLLLKKIINNIYYYS